MTLRHLARSFIVLLALLLPTAARADSIVYTRDTDVWLARPDGSRERRLTQGGGYQAPTQADDGTILVQRGTRFARGAGPPATTTASHGRAASPCSRTDGCNPRHSPAWAPR